MHRTHSFAFLVAATIAFSVTMIPRAASASPGTCTCNSGCHESPGMCIQKVFCSVGYLPSCGYRGGDGGAPECPKIGYLSCDGTCTCVPVPGGCEVFPDAEYCDSGPKDSSTDGVVDVDSSFPDTTTETTPPPDTPDGCVPMTCPPGTKAIAVPGECDPFCANPCGSPEFGCKGFFGTECKDGFCVPKCLTKPCAACTKCSVGTGTCEDDGSCSDGGDGGGEGSSDTSSSDSSSSDGAGDDTSLDSSPPGDGGGDELAQGDTGGCGCNVPGGTTAAELGLVAAAAALVVLVSRRRRS